MSFMFSKSDQTEEKLQNLGFDILSSMHWVVFVIIAVIFAGFVVLVNHSKRTKEERKRQETKKIIKKGQEKAKVYFDSTGKLDKKIFCVPPRTENVSQQDKLSEEACDESKSDHKYANDAINERIRRKTSSKTLAQIQRFMRSGQLFSFVNSAMSTPEKLAKRMKEKQARKPMSKEQQFERSLRARYGNNPLRNPTIDLQVQTEMENWRRRQQLQKQQEENSAPLCQIDTDSAEQIDHLFADAPNAPTTITN